MKKAAAGQPTAISERISAISLRRRISRPAAATMLQVRVKKTLSGGWPRKSKGYFKQVFTLLRFNNKW
jgi:hypothetical protein